MLGNAARICDAKFGTIFRWDGNALRLVATHNTPPAFAEYRKRRPLPLKPNLPCRCSIAGHPSGFRRTDALPDIRLAVLVDPMLTRRTANFFPSIRRRLTPTFGGNAPH